MVQTVKRALRKYGLQKRHLGDWNILLPWLAMGYRFSRQASLASFSPYFLLYGQDLDLPKAIHRESSEVVNLDDRDMWVRVCSQRAVLFRIVMTAAFENLAPCHLPNVDGTMDPSLAIIGDIAPGLLVRAPTKVHSM
ncbi:hypothetical protein AXG93_3271s1160 [Marchantia polymorpha subsp. ruderalis]|uniref:Uncharacterized protein n=1 Tax=Marchantia polymorpha subsp. ruderalis TaxID=1480154 RepID=A0A176VP52_MARPO|nr:hypothetical protein AXG93_3271s1160 [Marchantia polymorpha subsp. ruderalis]